MPNNLTVNLKVLTQGAVPLAVESQNESVPMSTAIAARNEVYICTFEGEGASRTCNKTIDEINAAFRSGKAVFGKSGDTWYTVCNVDENSVSFSASKYDRNSEAIVYESIIGTEHQIYGDKWRYAVRDASIVTVPEVEDEGKLLTADDQYGYTLKSLSDLDLMTVDDIADAISTAIDENREVFVIHFQENGGAILTATADKTVQEIKEAYVAGKFIYGIMDNDYYYPTRFVERDAGYGRLVHITPIRESAVSDTLEMRTLVMGAGTTSTLWFEYADTYSFAPSATSSDEGKVPMVDSDGQYALGSVLPDTTKYAESATVGGNAKRSVAIPFGDVDATSTSTVMTATVPGVTELYDGVCCYIRNGVVTSASGWTLNVNDLGAYPVYQTMAAAGRVTTTFNVAYTMLFIFNSDRVSGGCWDMYYGYNANDNTIAYNVRHYQTTLVMGVALTRYKVCFTRFDGKIVPSTSVSNSTGTAKALSTESFDPHAPIYYYSTTTGVAIDASPSASYMWTQYSTCDLRYGFNAGSTLTPKERVFIRCVPQTDGSVKLDGDQCIVQSLPTTADGKVYIYFGKAYSEYQVEMDISHPIYQYKIGKIVTWTGE